MVFESDTLVHMLPVRLLHQPWHRTTSLPPAWPVQRVRCRPRSSKMASHPVQLRCPPQSSGSFMKKPSPSSCLQKLRTPSGITADLNSVTSPPSQASPHASRIDDDDAVYPTGGQPSMRQHLRQPLAGGVVRDGHQHLRRGFGLGIEQVVTESFPYQ